MGGLGAGMAGGRGTASRLALAGARNDGDADPIDAYPREKPEPAVRGGGKACQWLTAAGLVDQRVRACRGAQERRDGLGAAAGQLVR